MRYTTIIDMSELPSYSCINARLTYLHLVLSAGYHAEDRDEVRVTLRQLSSQLNLTTSAVRHSLYLLERDGLVTRKDSATLLVKTFVAPVYAAPRSGKATVQNSAADQQRMREVSRLRSELESLRNAWRELEARGELDAYRDDMKKRASTVKKRLSELGEPVI